MLDHWLFLWRLWVFKRKTIENITYPDVNNLLQSFPISLLDRYGIEFALRTKFLSHFNDIDDYLSTLDQAIVVLESLEAVSKKADYSKVNIITLDDYYTDEMGYMIHPRKSLVRFKEKYNKFTVALSKTADSDGFSYYCRQYRYLKLEAYRLCGALLELKR